MFQSPAGAPAGFRLATSMSLRKSERETIEFCLGLNGKRGQIYMFHPGMIAYSPHTKFAWPE